MNVRLLKNKSFLFLQGPISPFYRELAYAFSKQGCTKLYKLQLCYSDKLWWDFTLIPYHDDLDNIQSFITKVIFKHSITDILLLGDCRPYHKEIVKQAKYLDCNIWSFEEGYIRPNTILLKYGQQIYSSHLKQADFYSEYKSRKINHSLMKVQNSTFLRLKWDFQYHLINFFNRKSFFHYKHHREAKIWKEYLGWLSRFSKKVVTDKFILPYKEKNIFNKPYFLAPLQLSHDFQITEHSNYKNVLEMIDEVLISFNKYSTIETMLVFKIHPFDTFVINPIKHIKKCLNKYPDLKKRIVILDGGCLNTLISNSLGIVVINSTVGLEALSQAKPVKSLSKAVYNFSGLTDQQPLNSFWRAPLKPNMDLVKKFKLFLLDTCLINGEFYSEEGINIAAINVTSHITKHYLNDSILPNL